MSSVHSSGASNGAVNGHLVSWDVDQMDEFDYDGIQLCFALLLSSKLRELSEAYVSWQNSDDWATEKNRGIDIFMLSEIVYIYTGQLSD